MPLPNLRLKNTLVGYSEIPETTRDHLSLVWNPVTAEVRVKRPGYPDLDIRLDREVECISVRSIFLFLPAGVDLPPLAI